MAKGLHVRPCCVCCCKIPSSSTSPSAASCSPLPFFVSGDAAAPNALHLHTLRLNRSCSLRVIPSSSSVRRCVGHWGSDNPNWWRKKCDKRGNEGPKNSLAERILEVGGGQEGCIHGEKPGGRHVQSDIYAATRRQVLTFAHQVVVGAGAAFIMPNFAFAAEEKVKTYTNIDDARTAGDKLRDIKEAADGPVIVSSGGIKYKELERGVGKPISPGDVVSVYFTISRLNGYYLDSMGYGKEGKNDVGETLNFEFGKGMVPEAVEGGMEGMQVGARRRILVTPEHGWVRPDLLPRPTSFFAERRLSDRRATQALLIEVELVKAKPMIE